MVLFYHIVIYHLFDGFVDSVTEMIRNSPGRLCHWFACWINMEIDLILTKFTDSIKTAWILAKDFLQNVIKEL